MKTSFVATIILGACASLVSGQAASITSLPSCAVQCGLQAFKTTGCQGINATCICPITDFIKVIKECVLQGCKECDEKLKVYDFAIDFCKNEPVTLNTTGFNEGCPNIPAGPGGNQTSGSNNSTSTSGTASASAASASASKKSSAAQVSFQSAGVALIVAMAGMMVTL